MEGPEGARASTKTGWTEASSFKFSLICTSQLSPVSLHSIWSEPANWRPAACHCAALLDVAYSYHVSERAGLDPTRVA